jgi:hypothetical protein
MFLAGDNWIWSSTGVTTRVPFVRRCLELGPDQSGLCVATHLPIFPWPAREMATARLASSTPPQLGAGYAVAIEIMRLLTLVSDRKPVTVGTPINQRSLIQILPPTAAPASTHRTFRKLEVLEHLGPVVHHQNGGGHATIHGAENGSELSPKTVRAVGNTFRIHVGPPTNMSMALRKSTTACASASSRTWVGRDFQRTSPYSYLTGAMEAAVTGPTSAAN